MARSAAGAISFLEPAFIWSAASTWILAGSDLFSMRRKLMIFDFVSQMNTIWTKDLELRTLEFSTRLVKTYGDKGLVL